MNIDQRKYVMFSAVFIVAMLANFSVAAQSGVKKHRITYVPVPDHPQVIWTANGNTLRTDFRNNVSLNRSITHHSSNQVSDEFRDQSNFNTVVNHLPPKELSQGYFSKVKRLKVDMFVGEVRVLSQRKVERVAIGRGAVLRADALDTGELLVIAEAAGSSSLRLWHEDGRQTDYNIRVTENDPDTRFRMEKMVRMRVRMVEFRKSALTRLGVDWSDTMNGPSFGFAGDAVSNNLFRPEFDGFSSLPLEVEPFSTYFGIAANLQSRINLMASTGDAKILAEPVLSGTNGGTASFLAGGEVPYPSVASNGETIVEFKEYGIRLEVEPRIDAGGNVRARVKTEISQLDPAVTVQGAPGLLTRRAQTEVNVRSGQTIVISGLLSSESSNDVKRLPGISRLPIIGRLFRSDNIRNNVSELVIFITPEVVDPSLVMMTEREHEFLRTAIDRENIARSSLKLRR